MVLSTSTTAPLVAVVGATGARGGSVVRHLLSSPLPYRLRAITRDPTKPAATTLAEKGIEVIRADLGISEEVKAAFKGASYVFGVTDFLGGAGADANKEIEHGKHMVDAVAATEGVGRFVFSSLDGVTRLSGGRYAKTSHFDSKELIVIYAKSKLRPNVLIVVKAAAYTSQFLPGGLFSPHKLPDDSYVFYPIGSDSKVPIINTERDFGAFVRLAIEKPDLAGDDIPAASED